MIILHQLVHLMLQRMNLALKLDQRLGLMGFTAILMVRQPIIMHSEPLIAIPGLAHNLMVY